MGIDVNVLEFMSRIPDRDYGETLWLGRQSLNLDPADPRVIHAIETGCVSQHSLTELSDEEGYASPLFRLFGSTSISSLDYSSFEGADVIWDMNLPIGREYHQKYDCIFDGGTLEHIYNFPIAIQNVKDMLRVGGLLISINGANNMLGHGLYQFSPELMWRVFSKEAGYEVQKMQLVPTGPFPPSDAADPQKAGHRVEISETVSPTYLMVAARKQGEIRNQNIFQSDYAFAWASNAN